MQSIPEEAIACFEYWSKFQVAFYDHIGCFKTRFPQNRCYHYSKFCDNVKCAGYEQQCYQFDFHETRRRAWLYRNGGIKICHAGVIELFAPIYSGELLAGVMVAGQRRLDGALPVGIPVLQSEIVVPPPEIAQLPPVAAPELSRTLEGLRQLAARLRIWLETDSGIDIRQLSLPREAHIELLVQERYRELTLETLAIELHLSRSRTAHLVKELTGKNLTQLLNEHKLKIARNLLTYTNHTVAEIAHHLGFRDTASFHRQFRRWTGTTPRLLSFHEKRK